MLRTIAYVSAAYDGVLAVAMLLFPCLTARVFGMPAPLPLINAQLNGVFALSLAAGYLWAARAPLARTGYFWAAGVLAKGAGAALFAFDHFLRGSPNGLLLFGLTDGTLALATLAALVHARGHTGYERHAGT